MDEHDNEHEWGLVLPFDTDNPEFCRGVEVGMLWTRLRQDDEAYSTVISTSNAEMALRIAEATDRHLTVSESLEDDHGLNDEDASAVRDQWMTATFSPSRSREVG